MNKEEYNKLLKDPRWKAKRLEILERDGNKCTNCGTTSGLQVHHKVYENDIFPWEYRDDDLITLCTGCHKIYHQQEGNKYRSYYAGVSQSRTYNKGEPSEFSLTNEIKIVSSKKIIDIFNEGIAEKDYSFMIDQVTNILDNVVNLYVDGLRSRIEISSKFTGDIEGKINIRISYDKPKLKVIKQSKYKKNLKYYIINKK